MAYIYIYYMTISDPWLVFTQILTAQATQLGTCCKLLCSDMSVHLLVPSMKFHSFPTRHMTDRATGGGY